MIHNFPAEFDPQPSLSGGGLTLRGLTSPDQTGLAEAASDPAIWAGHPNKDRYQAAVFRPYFDFLLKMGSTLAILDTNENRVIGCSAFYTDTNAKTRLSIGFTFLSRAYWGGSTNRVLKGLMLGHIFDQYSEAWFHIAPTNLRSQAATQKLGAVYTHEDQIDLGSGVQSWKCYCLTREAWARVTSQA